MQKNKSRLFVALAMILAGCVFAAAPSKRPFSISGMVWVPAGAFMMGTNISEEDQRPVHKVTLDGFWMDKFEVTNKKFDEFVKATKYVTFAERLPTAQNLGLTKEEFARIDPANIKAGSIVFTPPAQLIPLEKLRSPRTFYVWWRYVAGANWRHPHGPKSTIVGKENHPVVHICWHDAVAYTKWAKKKLPTEAQWEYAARGGLKGKEFIWGDKQKPAGKPMANIWHGRFPTQNTLEDKYRYTAPAGQFSPNGYGLYDMAGNVWEWCQDWYMPDYYKNSPEKNPPGPDSSFDPNEPGTWKRIQRGGSFLCTDLYCGAFRPAHRMKTTPDSGLSHSGFRCVALGYPPTKEELKQLKGK